MLMANETQPFVKHSLYVAINARAIADRSLVENDPVRRKALLDYIYYAALLHDLGKVIPEFQEWLKATPEEREKMKKKFSGVFHELYSYHILKEVTGNPLLLNPILWHHSLRGSQIDKTKAPAVTPEILDLVYKEGGVMDQLEEGLVETLQSLEDQVVLTSRRNSRGSTDAGQMMTFMGTTQESLNNKNYIKQVSHYQTSRKVLLNSIKDNALIDLVKVFVITADRIVSSVGDDWEAIPEKVEAFLDQKFPLEIDKYLNAFDKTSERGINQANAVKGMLKKKDQSVLSGPAGCGKTVIALDWHKRNGGGEGRPLYFVCPRLTIIRGIENELNKYEIPYSVWTGSRKDPINTNIVLISLDQILNAVKTHTKDEQGREITELAVSLANGNVIFDEFHENFDIPGLDLLFVELAMVCSMFKGNKTGFVSATPNPYALNYFMPYLSSDSNSYADSFRSVVKGTSDYIVKMPTHNHKDYRMEFIDEMPETLDPNTIVITNTVDPAVRENHKHGGMLVHGRYEDGYYTKVLEGVFQKFGKEEELIGERDEIMFASPQIQCSLNITCSTLITEFSTPENILQRIGRAGRFAENEITVVKILRNGGQSLNHAKTFQRSEKFYNELKKNFDGRTFKLNDLQEFYYEFYANYEGDDEFTTRLNKSLQILGLGVLNPRRSASKEEKKEEETVKLPNRTLRGQSRYAELERLTYDFKPTGQTIKMPLDLRKMVADHKGESFVSLNAQGKTEAKLLEKAREEEFAIDCSVDRPWGLVYVTGRGYISRRLVAELKKGANNDS